MKKIIIIITLLCVVLSLGCSLSNEKLTKKMLDTYSDNQNYVALYGEIIEYSDNTVVLNCEELREYMNYEDEVCSYYIHSSTALDLEVGDIIRFTTVPFHFYNGHKLPIVEVVMNGEVLLNFNEGKENLMDWVNTNF